MSESIAVRVLQCKSDFVERGGVHPTHLYISPFAWGRLLSEVAGITPDMIYDLKVVVVGKMPENAAGKEFFVA